MWSIRSLGLATAVFKKNNDTDLGANLSIANLIKPFDLYVTI